MDFQPFDGKLDDDTGFVPFNGKLDDGSFKSGESFKGTKDLIPSMEDLTNLWDTVKKQWENRHNTPMTANDMHKMMKSEHAAGSAIIDAIGGVPAMVAGGVKGLYTGIKDLDASKGLEAANKTIQDYLPSTLMGNKDEQDMGAYHTAMAPVTVGMDLLNAVPEGYGEILNALGADKAARQVSDAGKLGIIAGAGALGAKGMIESVRGKPTETGPSHADKLEPTAEFKPFEGKLDEEPVAPKPEEVGYKDVVPQQEEMFPTNPYDVAGHVSELEAGKPATVDSVQGDFFGKELEKSIPTGEVQPPVPRMNEITAFPEAVEANRKAAEAPIDSSNPAMQEAMVKAQRDAAFKQAEETAQAQKDVHYQQLEHQAIAQRAGEIDYQQVKNMGDKSLMEPAANDRMTTAIRDGKLSDAMQAIADNHPNRTLRDLALYLRDKVGDLKVQMHPEEMIKAGDRDVSGYFDPNTGVVGYSGIGATSPHTVMHEAVHGMTSQFLQDRPNDVRTVAIKNLYNKLADKIERSFPGVVNHREFVAEAFSNPKFQEFLKGQRIDNRTAFQRFIDGVKNIFGIKPDRATTLSDALTHTIDLSKQVIEASDKVTRDSIMENFKSAGLNSKLADLMATEPKDTKTPEVVQGGDLKTVASKIPGLIDPISDFKFYDKPVSEIIEMAKNAPDIPVGAVEKFAQQMQGGALFESLKTRNPIVKYTYERITRAFQEASHAIKVNLTDQHTGLKHYMRELTPDMKGEIHSLMMLNEGQRVFTSAELAERGFNDKQIAYYNKYRELDDAFYNQINTQRVALGFEPMDRRIGHVAGRFLGDFYTEVTAQVPHPTTGIMQTKMVGRISGSTKWEMQKAIKAMKEKHPEWDFGEPRYNKLGGSDRKPADRFSGFMEALNFISKTDSDAAALIDSYREYIKSDAVNYLNATRSAKAKVKEAGGIQGSEGHKEWKSAVENAEEGMKAQLSYFEQGYEWMSVQKAVNDLKPMFADETLAKTNPRALEYANQYVDHALGRNQGKVAEVSNMVASMLGEFSGLGHSNLMKWNNQVKHFMMQKFMGLMNIPFSVTQLMQPLQTHPAMITLLKNRGLEFSAFDAQLKATNTYLNGMLNMDKLSTFEKQAWKYADEMSIFDVKMTDHLRDINASPVKETYNRIADFNINVPEKFTRGMAFMFYAHALKDAGIPLKDVFGAAENMTNLTMVNYHQIERPMGYAKLGWIGDVASTLTRYKHNQYSQMAFYAREGIHSGNAKGYAPLAAFLGTSLAFGGIMGFFAYNEADSVYQLFTEKVLEKPDSLSNMMFKHNVPQTMTHGLFSTLGLDMTTRFSNANLVPDSIGAAVMPYGSAILDMAQTTGRFVLDPTNEFKQKQFVKAMAPQSAQGLIENKLFSKQLPNGNSLYINPTDGPNLGKGRVERTEADQRLRNFGFRDIRESKELAQNYANSQIAKGNKNLAEGMIQKAVYATLGNKMTPETMKGFATKAASFGMSPDAFASAMVQWGIDNNLTQADQQKLRNAMGGFTGAFNLEQQR